MRKLFRARTVLFIVIILLFSSTLVLAKPFFGWDLAAIRQADQPPAAATDGPVSYTTSGHVLPITDELGVNIHFTGNQPDIDMIANAGFSWVRTDMFWSAIEQLPGHYDFVTSGYDALTDALISKGIRPYYILDYGNPLYGTEQGVLTDQGRQAFANFARAAAEHYKGKGVVWEIWNEPNMDLFWQPQPSYLAYASLVKTVVPAIKQTDPSVEVVGGAVGGMDFAWLEGAFKHGILDDLDAVSVHPYRGSSPSTVIADYQSLHNLISKYTTRNIPVISGEWGYSTAVGWSGLNLTETDQARRLIQMFLLNDWYHIPVSIAYDWKNDGTDPHNGEHNFGIVQKDLQPKVAYLAIQTLSTTLKGYHLVQKVEQKDRRDYVFKYVNDQGGTIFAFWSDCNDAHDITLPLQGGGQIVTMLGQMSYVQGTNTGLDTMISASPNYLVIPPVDKQ